MIAAVESKVRSQLKSAGQTLKASIAVNVGDLPEAVLNHVRRAFDQHELLKIRVHGDDRVECQLVADQLVEKVPCELVSIVGRVLLLYRPKPPESATAEQS